MNHHHSGNAGGKLEKVIFHKRAPEGSRVYLSGSFNGWQTDACPMTDLGGNGIYSCCILLAPGIYEYKFVVDGVWTLDESNPEFAVSSLGTFNNIVEVKARGAQP